MKPSEWSLRSFMGTIGLVLCANSICATSASAQNAIVPDNTLGAEASIVESRPGFDAITGGATRGTGLFHSFQQFDINSIGAYFLVRPETQNVFARVTGSQASIINGTFGVRLNDAQFTSSTANLFLLNPNGILFGPNAQLNFSGSFLATTASQFQFADGKVFSAIDPQAAPLLTIAVPVGLQFGAKPGAIEVNGAQLFPAGSTRGLSLLGGEVKIRNSRLTTLVGQMDIGAVSGNQAVGLVPLNSGFKADYSQVRRFEDIAIDQSRLFIGTLNLEKSPTVPVNLQLQGQRISLSNDSSLIGFYTGVETPNLRSGKIVLNASEAVDFDHSRIFSGGDGSISAPGIEINTGILQVSNGSNLVLGEAGGLPSNIDIRASQGIQLRDGPKGVSQIASINDAQNDSTGGDLNITTPALEIYGGSGLLTLLLDKGKTGDINLKVDQLLVSGERRLPSGSSSTPSPSGISSISGEGSVGDSGNIRIQGSQVNLLDGGRISMTRLGKGQAGTIDLKVAGAIVVRGSTVSGLPSAIENLQVGPQSLLKKEMPGVIIQARQLFLEQGARLGTQSIGEGDSLDMDIRVDEDVIIRGITSQSRILRETGRVIFPQSVISSAKRRGMGNGGNIKIRAKNIQLLEGGQIESEIDRASEEIDSPVFQGKAGDIMIVSENLTISGQAPNSIFSNVKIFSSSRISSGVGTNGNAQGGNIQIQSGTVQVLGGGRIESDMLNRGQAGNIEINATGDINVIGSGKDEIAGFQSFISSFAAIGTQGNAGAVTLRSNNLNLFDGGMITTSTLGQGNAGNIVIVVQNDFNLRGQSAQGDRSRVTSGSVTITPEQRVLLLQLSQDGAPVFPITPLDLLGESGQIQISARNLRMDEKTSISTFSEGRGTAGNIKIQMGDRASLNNAEIITSAARTSGGNIALSAPLIVLRNDSNIKTNIGSGSGSGGNINLTADGIVLLDDSDLLAFARDGKGGNITLRTSALITRTYKPSDPNADLETLDKNGFVDINATGRTTGLISLPNVNLLEKNRPALPQTLIDTNNLLSRSCIARNPQTGKFYITGAGGLPPQPGDATPSSYSTLPVSETIAQAPPEIREADGIYALPNGEIAIAHRCSSAVTH